MCGVKKERVKKVFSFSVWIIGCVTSFSILMNKMEEQALGD